MFMDVPDTWIKSETHMVECLQLADPGGAELKNGNKTGAIEIRCGLLERS